jgi:hypothetical protein
MKFIDRYGNVIIQEFGEIGVGMREYDDYIVIKAHSKFSEETYPLATFDYTPDTEKIIYDIAQCGVVLICYADQFIQNREFFKVTIENIMKAFKYDLHGEKYEDCLVDFHDFLCKYIHFDNEEKDIMLDDIYNYLLDRISNF